MPCPASNTVPAITARMELPHHTNAEGYFVPDTTYHDPKNRRMRVITIGAGFSGILLAYRLQRELENVEASLAYPTGSAAR